MDQKLVKIGLLGIGKMGQNHLRNLNLLKNVEVSFIYDVNLELLKRTAENFGVRALQSEGELESALENSDGVIIVTPTFTHFDYFKKVCTHCKNIFIEKPLTDTLDTSREICERAKERDLRIAVGFIERYNPAISALKNLLSNGVRIFNADFVRTNKQSARITDVDVVMDLMIHDIDLALLFNGAVVEISAYGVVLGGSAELARAVLRHSNGAFSNILASRITEKRIRQISLTCENAYIDCNLLSKEVLINRQSVEQRLQNISIQSSVESIEVRPQEALFLELLAFAQTCRGEKTDQPNEKDGLSAMLVANKIQEQIYNRG